MKGCGAIFIACSEAEDSWDDTVALLKAGAGGQVEKELEHGQDVKPRRQGWKKSILAHLYDRLCWQAAVDSG